MKNLLALAAIAASLAALAPTAQAATVTGTFTVGATLTSACTIGTFGSNVSIPYTANAAAATGTTSATVTCTRTFAPTSVEFADAGTDGAGNVAVASTASGGPGGAVTTNGAGLLFDTNLNYTIEAGLSAQVLAGNSATSAIVGSGRTFTADVTVTIPQQYGTCAAASCVTTNAHTRTLTLTY